MFICITVIFFNRRGVLDTTLCDKVCQGLAASRWFSTDSFTNKSDRHDITELLLKVALNNILLILYSSQAKF
jgi:hypothetical protein